MEAPLSAARGRSPSPGASVSPKVSQRMMEYEEHGGVRRATTAEPGLRGQEEAYMQSKLKYHRALAGSASCGASSSSSRVPSVVVHLVHPPPHVLPAGFFIRLPFGLGLDQADSQGRQGSVGFIFTVCSTMMGSTLMCLPWGFERAGLIAGTALTLGFGLISFYTCSLILDWGAQPSHRFGDFSDLCQLYLGPVSKHVANVTSIAIILGAMACYHVLMANNLQEVMLSAARMVHLEAHVFCCGGGNYQYALASVYVAVAVLPLLFVREIGRLAAIGSFGAVALLYNVAFLVGSALAGQLGAAPAPPRRGPVKLVGSAEDIGVFVGMMGLSLFLQSVLLPISANHARAGSAPAAVKRDLGVAMACTALLYVAVGAVPAAAAELGSLDGVPGLPQNILLAYGWSSWGALVGRLALVLQIGVVYPIMGAVMRRQFFSGCTQREWPGWAPVAVFNVGLVGVTALVAAVYPNPGSVVGYVGAYTAVVYMLWLPILVHLSALRKANRSSWASLVGNIVLAVSGSLVVLLQFLA